METSQTPYADKVVKAAGTAVVFVSLSVLCIPQAEAVTANGNIDANIVSLAVPALTPLDELNFGEIITTGAAGTVEISTAGAPTLSNVTLSGTSPHQQGVMRVTGNPGALVDINIVPGAYFVDNGFGVTMPVTSFDIGNGPNNAHTVTIGAGATIDVNIGATLAVGAGQQAGSYSGTFTLNADYQ